MEPHQDVDKNIVLPVFENARDVRLFASEV
jgi:hypothetical protein